MELVNEYRIIYSVLDYQTGEILEENSEQTIYSKNDKLACGVLAIKVNHQYRDCDTHVVIHVVETHWHGQ